MDIQLSNHGSICILQGVSREGNEWLRDHLAEDAQRWGSGYVVEPRYVEDILDGAMADGLDVEH